jgi:hypothetical protein
VLGEPCVEFSYGVFSDDGLSTCRPQDVHGESCRDTTENGVAFEGSCVEGLCLPNRVQPSMP